MTFNCDLPRDKQIELIKTTLDYKGPTIRNPFYTELIGINRPSPKVKVYHPSQRKVYNDSGQEI